MLVKNKTEQLNIIVVVITIIITINTDTVRLKR